MLSARQVISHFRFGFMNAAGIPVSVGQDLFAAAPEPMRATAKIYDDADVRLSPAASPRRMLSPLKTTVSATRSGLRDIATDFAPASRLKTAPGNLQPLVPPSSYFAAHSQSEPDIAPWNQQDEPLSSSAIKRSNDCVPSGQNHGRRLQESASLPSIAASSRVAQAALTPEAVLRLIAARLHRIPRRVRALFDQLDDGSGDTSTSALVDGIVSLGASTQPVLSLSSDVLAKLVSAFDWTGSSMVSLRDFARALASGRLPTLKSLRRAHLSVRGPELPVQRRKRASQSSQSQLAKNPSTGCTSAVLSSAPAVVASNGAFIASARPTRTQPHTRAAGQTSAEGSHAKTKASPRMQHAPPPTIRPQAPSAEGADPEQPWNRALVARKQSSRGAHLLVAAISAKSDEHGGKVSREQFHEVMYDLGVLSSYDTETDTLFGTRHTPRKTKHHHPCLRAPANSRGQCVAMVAAGSTSCRLARHKPIRIRQARRH